MKRDYFTILNCILQVAVKGCNKTNMMYKCNLCWTIFKKYFNLVLDLEMIRLDNNGLYYTTKKGLDYLKYWNRIERLLNTP